MAQRIQYTLGKQYLWKVTLPWESNPAHNNLLLWTIMSIAQVWSWDLSGDQHVETGERHILELLEDVAVVPHEDLGLLPGLPLPGQLWLVHHHSTTPLSPVPRLLASWQTWQLLGAAEICQLQRRADISCCGLLLPHQIRPAQLGWASAGALSLMWSLP